LANECRPTVISDEIADLFTFFPGNVKIYLLSLNWLSIFDLLLKQTFISKGRRTTKINLTIF